MTVTITKRRHSQTGEVLEYSYGISGEDMAKEEWDRLRRDLWEECDDARFSFAIIHNEDESYMLDYSISKEPEPEYVARFYDDGSSYIEPPHYYSRQAMIARLKCKDWLTDLSF